MGTKWSIGIGVVMVVVGVVLYFVFRDVETPIVGLRQAGVVLAVVGVLEVAGSGYAWWRASKGR
ncbi:DUF5708 family protein [Nocardia transvalensis]|uniref:DUF5708 family protein n=1 Tax=Nocardia transvalensis TaxID=37333 RepID=UPI001895A3EF|nr:DUF5708 family protein [Nocardia transvalensis]MBF6330291.1 hypothetical protein [Nocardia transvalensis]